MSGIQSIRNGLTGNLTKVIVIAIIITFIGSVGWAGFFSQGNANVIATVGSKDITTSDLNFELSSQQVSLNQRFPDQEFDDEILINLSRESLIGKFAVLDHLDKKGLELSDSFVYKQLENEEQFQENGNFSVRRFESFARSNGFIPADYLKRVKEDLLVSIWRQALVNSLFVTDSEVKNSINLAEQERDITFLKIPSKQFEVNVNTEEVVLKKFYQENLDLYISPEKANVKYLLFNQEDIILDEAVSEEAIQIEYQDYLDSFDSTTRKSVSHIMLNLDADRNLEQAKSVLTTVKNRIGSGELFEDLVKEISEDEGTKELKGSLGVTDGTLLPPEFEEALLTMEEGETFGPIELSSTVHLIKLDDLIQPQPLEKEDKYNEIKDLLIERESEEAYVNLIDKASDLVFTSSSLENVASNFTQELITSELFSSNDMPLDLDFGPVRNFIFNDSDPENFPEVIETSPTTAVLIQIIDFVDEQQMSFESVQEKVLNTYIEQQAFNSSEEFLAKSTIDLGSEKSLETLSKEQNTSIESYSNLKRDSSLLPQNAVNEIFSLPRSGAGKVHGSSRTQNGDLLIYRLDSVSQGNSDSEEISIEGIEEFLYQQHSLSELTELQLRTRDSLSIQIN